jgi:hypothetical protein
MKPLIRYTIGGNPSQIGIDILKYSIDKLKMLLGDRVDYVVCHNNIEIDKLNDMEVSSYLF